MYAVIETGGKQIKVSSGQRVRVEKLPVAVGEEVIFNRVLLLRDDASVMVGTPYLEGVSVIGRVVDHIKDKKVIIFKHKRRKNYRKKIGHRQLLTVVDIQSINRGDAPEEVALAQ
ncbi:MAG: 50S ribosomal protein L21 [Syntrophobacterales bacterium]|nr:50S ribosomal protein L21 [Syntrophobacterales bacterium]